MTMLDATPADAAHATDLAEVVDEIEDLADDHDDLVVQDVLEHYDGRAYGLWILLPGLVALSPAGALPLVPSLCAVVLILITVQAMLGREKPWLPMFIRRRHLSDRMVSRLTRFARPLARGVDWVLRPRLTALVSGRAQYLIAVAVLVLALLMIPLELVPMAVFLPAGAITLLALGLTAKDGLLVLAAAVVGVMAVSGAVVLACGWMV